MADPALTVQVVRPTQVDWLVEIRADGNIAAWQEAVVACTTGGLRIVELQAEIGDRVKAGQELAILDTSGLRAQVQGQEAEVEQAEATFDLAAEDAKRAKGLLAGGGITAQQDMQYRSTERSSRGRLAAARAQLEVNRLALARARVAAPDDGVVISRDAVLGDVAQSGAKLFCMIRQDRLEWRAEVLADDLPRIQAGQPACIALPGGGTVQGTVRSVEPTIAVRTRTAIVHVDLPAGAAKVGMFASGTIAISSSAALAAPATTVLQRDGRSLVFTVGPDQRVHELPVTVGRRHGDLVEIASAAGPDSRIVASGGAFLADGDLVSVAGP